MRKENSDFKTAFVSEAGSHFDNRDYFAFVELDDMACYVVADGLDLDKEVRSAQMAVEVILESFMEKPSMSRRKIRQDLEAAHEWLKFESRRVRLKASVLVVVTDYTRMVWATCGNARLYQFRGGRVNLRSKDQSLTQLMLDQGRLAEDRNHNHEERGNLLNYMGRPDRFEPYVSDKMPLSDGDVLLLATQGVWEQVDLPEMLDALAEASDPESLTDTLEEVVLSKQQKSVNNYTAAAVYVNKTFTEKPKNIKKWILRGAMLLLTLAIAGGGVWYVKAKQAEKLAQTAVLMVESEEDGDRYASAGDYAKALKSYSEAKNAASKLKDKLHFQLLRGKQQVAQFLSDGDGYVQDGSYDMAVDSYNDALKQADKYKPFKAEDIKARIERAGAIEALSGVIKEGDKLFQEQDYNGALAVFQKAKKAAIEAEYESGQKKVEEKIEQTQAKIDNIYKETRTLKADNLEKKGDRSLAAMDYAAAIESYKLAQEIYQEIDKLERVLAMERKISQADEKLNPAVPAAGSAGESAGATAGAGGSAAGNLNQQQQAAADSAGGGQAGGSQQASGAAAGSSAKEPSGISSGGGETTAGGTGTAGTTSGNGKAGGNGGSKAGGNSGEGGTSGKGGNDTTGGNGGNGTNGGNDGNGSAGGNAGAGKTSENAGDGGNKPDTGAKAGNGADSKANESADAKSNTDADAEAGSANGGAASGTSPAGPSSSKGGNAS
ncbi:MAG: serine/threonine protein phosphatase [Paenibacillus macerans]|uniref:Stage II sporulation E family protein n=2 Tax=Paenibacillus macerans TaxID=44252 RepID=A0A090ZH28_PAEMA|nr:serine/threonine protein phosphatase [Paenibacillus macerans]KFN10604.1 stage II sporulation E family protein [Paenibacillus macerans]MCY7556855.1 serine/threonine protein phosphatase [Paenibacillus macerans]MDU7472691.1 serine/threonine protein phosphatase [Paenibacillus macerans]MEC0139060.1 serine/threonine protein phosphatase [Paenibacillus macerans]MEC0150094.1 serine/threonine protein phosphatase [Paenibacillus macerans]